MPEPPRLAPRGTRSWQDGETLVIGLGASIDELQASGQWLKTTDPVEVER